MAVAVEALALKDCSHLRMVSSQEDTSYQQMQLVSELPFGVRTPVIDPEAFTRMSARDANDQHKQTEVWLQGNLTHFPSNFVEPDEYHREYPTETGSTYYAAAVRYDAESGFMRPTGRNTIVASGDIYGVDGEVVERTTLQVGYEDRVANYLGVNRQNLQRLSEYYDARSRGERISPPEIREVSIFSGPFSEEKTFAAEAVAHQLTEYVYREADKLVLEKVDIRNNLVHRVELPYSLDENLYTQLVIEGKSGQSEDSDEAFLAHHEISSAHEDDTIYEVPQKYPVMFSSHQNLT